MTPAPACPREKRSDTPAVPRENRDVTPLPAAPREYREVTYGTVEGVRLLDGLVRVTAGADVLDRPGTPGDRVAPVYSGLLAGGVAVVGVASRMGRVASIREVGGRVEVGEVRTGGVTVARGVCPTRSPPVRVGGATGTVVRVLRLGLVRAVGVETLERLDGMGELKIPVRLEPLGADRVGVVIVLRDRGDTTAGWTVRGEGDTVLVEGRAAGLAAGREMLTGALRA